MKAPCITLHRWPCHLLWLITQLSNFKLNRFNSDSSRLFENMDSNQLMTQAKAIDSRFDSWLNSESNTSLQVRCMYPRIVRFRFFVLHRYQNQNRTVLERSTRGTRSVLHQSTVGAKKPQSFANLKEIVHLQHMVLNWDSHTVESVENPLLVKRLPGNTLQPKKCEISTNKYRFYRSSASMRRGHTLRPFISDWLMFKIVECDWLMNLRCTGYPFDKTNDYKWMKQNNDSKCLFL